MSDQNPPPSDPGFGAQPPPQGSYDAPPAGAPYGAAPGGGHPAPAGAPAAGGILSATWLVTEGPPAGWQPKQKMVAGILGILIGSLGIHSFYLGNTKKGIIQIVATFLTCGLLGLWGLVEGIMILVGSANTTTDAYGVPLTD